MAWLTKRKTSVHEAKINRLHNFLSMAFQKVKQDMNHTFRWLHYFNQKHNETDQRLAKIEEYLDYLPGSHDEIKRIIDNHYAYDPIHQKIEELNKKIDELHQQRESEKTNERKAPLKERLMRKISKNSKGYVKSVILSFIKKYDKISGPQLKEIIVEEQGLCSKSSFYRLLQELEQDDEIGVIEKNKEKIYVTKAQIIK
jgi:hypothetical protein